MPIEYSLAAIVRAMMTQTWGRVVSPEHVRHCELVKRYGPCSRGQSARIPHDALRDMTAAGVSGSNYLVATDTAGYLPALQPASAVLGLGAQTLHVEAGNIVLPKGDSATTTQWLLDEHAAITEGQPTVGQIGSSPKILAALCEISHQTLKQSNAEEVVRTELRNAAASAIDKAAIQGGGSAGQPTGIVTTPGVGTFTGGTLNRAELTNAQLDVATANAVISGNVGYLTTPAVANTLANRADTIESTRALWRGPLHDGLLCDVRARSTTNVPTATAIYGDWANVTVVSWGAAELAVDPFTKFDNGIVAVRLLMLVDVVVTRAAGFSVASSIT